MDNKKKITIIVVVIALAILLLVVMSNKGNSKGNNNSQIANLGEKLEINEKTAKFNIKVLTELAKHIDTETLLSEGEYIKIKVAVENLDSSDLSLLATNFSLVDSSKNTIATATPYYTVENNIFDENIASGDDKDGYLYFYGSYDEEKGIYTTDYTKLNNIKYLKISVISDSDGKKSYSREDYYIEIK